MGILAAYDVYIVSESSDFIKEILLTHTPYINMKIDEEHKKKSELHWTSGKTLETDILKYLDSYFRFFRQHFISTKKELLRICM